MERLKYIVVSEAGLPQAIVFNPILDHSAVARAFPQGSVQGAGFVSFDLQTGKPYISGESVTLKMKPGPDDYEALCIFGRILRDG